jgi:hypothetical protein
MQSQIMKDFFNQVHGKGKKCIVYKGGLKKSVQTCQDEPGCGRNLTQQLLPNSRCKEVSSMNRTSSVSLGIDNLKWTIEMISWK